MTLADKLRAQGLKEPSRAPKRKGPVWKGPEVDGITYSLLCRFLTCRERFRLLVVEGLKSEEGFNHRIEFGNMWHVCEEALAAGAPKVRRWDMDLMNYCKKLCRQYPLQQEQIDHWYNICKLHFPLYVERWSKHRDVVERTPLFQEHIFEVPYTLPSGRIVKLKGKWDSVDMVGHGKQAAIFLQENKTKGDIDEGQMKRQLSFDLQTMLYLVSLHQKQKDGSLSEIVNPVGDLRPIPIKGVRYNVIRRPLSGGKGSIRRHQATKNHPEETKAAFYQRAIQYVRDEPEAYFMRWEVLVLPHDVLKFRRECLDPMLDHLCDWWEFINLAGQGLDLYGPNNTGLHWRHPFGVRNIIDEGGSTDVDAFLESGSQVGLRRVDTLFPELETTI